MAKLQDFISNIKSTGLMRTARYSVIFPAIDTSGTLVAMYCDQVQLPGLNYSTTASLTYGETREMPYTRIFEPITLSFYVDNDMKVKKYFDNWMTMVQNPTNRTFNYYKQYIKDIQIDVEDLEDNKRYSVTLYECYPKTLGAIQLDYSSKDVMKLSITLQYKYWKATPLYDNNINYINSDALGISSETQNIFNGISKSLTIQYDALEIANREISATSTIPRVTINQSGW